jgi:hypothetical protein
MGKIKKAAKSLTISTVEGGENFRGARGGIIISARNGARWR